MIETLQAFSWAGNTGYDYALSIAILLASVIVLKIFQMIILARLNKLAKRTATDFDDTLIDVFKSIKPPFYFFAAVYLAIKVLSLPSLVSKVLFVLFAVAIVYEVIRAIEKLLVYFIRKYLDRTQENPEEREHSESMIRTMQVIVRALLWMVGLILLLANLGVNVTSLIAGLGIGGIAIALALQGVLSDLFSSFSIYIDKPFRVGDYIMIGTDSGHVQKIGLKTTRIKTLQGEELIISNQELTNARVKNFKRMEQRRISFNIGVVYGTPKKKLEEIPQTVEAIIKSVKLTRFERCYFVEHGDSALIYEIVYFVDSSDYKDYLNTRQEINLALDEQFSKAKIDFAYPTQTILHKKA